MLSPHVARGDGGQHGCEPTVLWPALLENPSTTAPSDVYRRDVQARLETPELMEKLAAIEHERWPIGSNTCMTSASVRRTGLWSSLHI